MNEKISDTLKDLGIPVSLLGYSYLRKAISMVIVAPAVINQLTKTIYPVVALEFNTTPSRVERAIKHAIEVGCVRGSLSAYNSIFRSSFASDKGKPTNGEFIATVADWLTIKYGGSL